MGVLSYYSIMVLIIALIWILIFIIKSELRKEMLILGILSIFLLPIWMTTQATQSFEMTVLFKSLQLLDVVFLFSISGIAGTIFHVFFGKHYKQMPKIKAQKNKYKIAHWWILRIFFSFLLFTWTTILLSLGLNLELPTSLLLSAIILAVYIVSHRHDLLTDCIWSAALTGGIVFIASSLGSMFTNTSPIIPFIQTDQFINNVSADLLLWALALGLVLGPLYEYTRRKALV